MRILLSKWLNEGANPQRKFDVEKPLINLPMPGKIKILREKYPDKQENVYKLAECLLRYINADTYALRIFIEFYKVTDSIRKKVDADGKPLPAEDLEFTAGICIKDFLMFYDFLPDFVDLLFGQEYKFEFMSLFKSLPPPHFDIDFE